MGAKLTFRGWGAADGSCGGSLGFAMASEGMCGGGEGLAFWAAAATCGGGGGLGFAAASLSAWTSAGGACGGGGGFGFGFGVGVGVGLGLVSIAIRSLSSFLRSFLSPILRAWVIMLSSAWRQERGGGRLGQVRQCMRMRMSHVHVHVHVHVHLGHELAALLATGGEGRRRRHGWRSSRGQEKGGGGGGVRCGVRSLLPRLFPLALVDDLDGGFGGRR